MPDNPNPYRTTQVISQPQRMIYAGAYAAPLLFLLGVFAGSGACAYHAHTASERLKAQAVKVRDAVLQAEWRMQELGDQDIK